MSDRFETRLERELLAAARRRAARPDGAPERRARRLPRPPRALLSTAVAIAALLALAVLALALPGGGDPPSPPAARPLPRQCDRAARTGLVRLTSAPVDHRLLAGFAALRRKQRASDRTACPVGPMTGTANPSAIRLLGRTGLDDRVFLVPATSMLSPVQALRDKRRPRTRRGLLRRSGPMLCAYIVNRRGSWAGGPCQPPRIAHAGALWGRTNDRRTTVLYAVVRDGVAAIELTFANGSTRQLSVADHLATLTLRSVAPRPGTTVARYALLDADGATLESHRGRNEVAMLQPVDVPRMLRMGRRAARRIAERERRRRARRP